MTTVVCVWVRGHVPYDVIYVTRLQAMVRRWLDRPHRFVCLTDRPGQLPSDIEPLAIASPAPLRAWWAKVRLFDPALGLTGRVLYLDLDTLVVAPLAPVIDVGAPFALAPPGGTFNGKDGLTVVKRFNSSVMVWNAGEQSQIFSKWTPATAQRLWGDQDHIGELCPGAATFPPEWCPRLSKVSHPFPSPTKVVLCKVPKNHVAASQWPWFDALWRAA